MLLDTLDTTLLGFVHSPSTSLHLHKLTAITPCLPPLHRTTSPSPLSSLPHRPLLLFQPTSTSSSVSKSTPGSSLLKETRSELEAESSESLLEEGSRCSRSRCSRKVGTRTLMPILYRIVVLARKLKRTIRKATRLRLPSHRETRKMAASPTTTMLFGLYLTQPDSKSSASQKRVTSAPEIS